MNPNERIIGISQLQTGDVLLCVIGGRLAEKVESNTGSKYTHAGICYNGAEVVDVTLNGIQKSTAAQFVSGSNYVAVFRNPYIWNQIRFTALQRFLDNAINAGTHYDRTGARTFAERKSGHQMALLAKLRAHFEEGLKPVDHNKLKYICSELVVAAFIAIGFIKESAAIAYQPDTYSPGDLGRDPTFGFFVGYLKPETTTEIPLDDEFANKVKLSELMMIEAGA